MDLERLLKLDYERDRYKQPIVDRSVRSDKGKKRVKYSSLLSPKYKSYLMRCNSKGIKMELTEEQFNTIIAQPCYLCGSTTKIGVDRLNSSFGYVEDNVKPCCTICNMMKYTHDVDFFLSHVRRIVNHNSI